MADLHSSTSDELSRRPELRRLGRNHAGYRGETIDIDAVLADCVVAARAHGWAIEEFGGYSGPRLMAFTRSGPRDGREEVGRKDGARSEGVREPMPGAAPRRVYLSTGIHGDEPAGPLAVRQLLREDRWPAALDLWLCPCLNPEGFRWNRRENEANLDLNRQYKAPQASETIAHITWLERQPRFDLCLCLHEDWESHGFYVYELNPEHRASLAEGMVEAVSEVCPIDNSEMIEGRPASKGIIRPDIDPRGRPQWPEAFYLLTHKTRLSYTLEAPSDFGVGVRVAALVKAVEKAVES